MKPKRLYEVMVSITDGKNTAKTLVTITVMGINEMPMFTERDPTTRSIPEEVDGDDDGPIAIDRPIVANDPDNTADELTYAIAPGPDSALFTIGNADLDRGQLMVVADADLDYDMKLDGTPPKRTYQIVVTVTDSLNEDSQTIDAAIDDTIMVTVNVTNRNEAPSFSEAAGDTTDDGAFVYAGKAGNRVIDPKGLFRATDPDGDTLRYNLAGTHGSLFRIDSNGMVTTRQALPKTPETLSVTVTAQDHRGLVPVDDADTPIDQTVHIAVKPVTAAADNEKPVFPDTVTGVRTVAENTSPGETIGAPVEATDPDEDDTLTYRLGGTDATSFAINPATGQLMTKAMLDKEDKETYTVTVTANDGVDDSVHKQVTITVDNVLEAPMFDEGQTTTRSVPENRPAETEVGDPVDADDSDGDALTYTLSGDAVDSFAIDATTGQLMTREMLDHEDEDGNTHTGIVTASDGVTLRDDTITVIITVTDANDDPMFATGDTPRAARSVEENTPKGEDIGAASPVRATDQDDDPVTHSLRGTDSSVFDIEPTTGQLKTNKPLDHETKGSYSVTVRAVDGRGGSTDTQVTITVSEVNDLPMFPSNRVNRTVKENHPAADAVKAEVGFGAPVLATDQEDDGDDNDNTNVRYAVSGPDARFFTIDSNADDDGDTNPVPVSQFGQLMTVDSPRLDYEADRNRDGRVDATDRTYEVVVTATDSGGLTASTIVTVTVTNVDEGPMFAEAEVSRFVLENAAAKSLVGPPVTATDPEGDSIKYTIDGDDKALFDLHETSGQLSTKDGLDHETKPTATVKVVATVAKTATAAEKKDEATVTITVVDVSEPPMFEEVAPIERDILEGDAGAAVVGGPVTATDPDGGFPTYTLKPSIDAESFEIDQYDGTLTSKVKLDFEADRNGDRRHTSADYTYMVTVIATDVGGLYSEATVTITVINEPEAPMFPDLTGELFVYEGAQGAKVYDPDGVLIATDGDGDTLTYELSGDDADTFDINRNTGQLTTAKALDYDANNAETVFSVTVSVSDGTGSLDATKNVTIRLRDVTEEGNRAPQFYMSEADRTPISQTPIKVAENMEGVIGYVYADDADGDKLVYTLRVRDKSLFTIGSDGALLSKKPLDFDGRSSYTVVVTASDSQLSDTLTVTITGTNVNEAPMFVDADGFPIPSAERSIIEEGRSGRNIGEPVLAMDPDRGDQLMYTLDPESQAVFSTYRTSSGVQLRAKTVLDREDKASYTVTITVRDSKDDDGDPDTAPDDTITVTVTVTNINERSEFANADGTPFDKTRTVDENQVPNTKVGAPVTAIDEEDDPLTYSLLNANTASVPFKIGAGTGQLTTTAALDHEDRAAYTVTVYASDRKDANDKPVAANVNDYDASVRITVNVKDVDDETTNRPPAFVTTKSTYEVAEKQAAGTRIGASIEARDPDVGDTLMYDP